MEIETQTRRGSPPVYGGSTAAGGEGGAVQHSPPPPHFAWSPSPASQGRIQEQIVALARSWIGTPYVHQASLKGVGCDCLGLLRGIWRELHGEEQEAVPPYSLDWAEATGAETLYIALARHAHEVPLAGIASGDVALFRMSGFSRATASLHERKGGPAKHCGIVAEKIGSPSLIHSRQNKRVSEEPFSPFWRSKLAYAFRL